MAETSKKPKIKPLGIGELKVVKQKLIGYEARKIAHIENIMATESRGREHRRLRQIEETIISEQERKEESKRDLQSTERFELQLETEKTIKSETKFEAGAEISAGYGPFVQVSASVGYSTSQSTTESERNATNYAKETIEKSLHSLMERVRQERTTRTLEELEEKNEHRFENAEGGNKSGIYLFVDKYFRAKVVNYGKRLFYKFLVPEPAAFYIFAQRYNRQNNLLPTEPEIPVDPKSNNPLQPDHIKRDTYLELISLYEVEGISPPPPEDIVISRIIARDGLPIDRPWAFADNELTTPKGYVAESEYVKSNKHYTDTDKYYLKVRVGSRLSWWYYGKPHLDSNAGQEDHYLLESGRSIDDIRGTIPIGVTGFKVSTVLIYVEVICTLTEEAFEEWQIKTYNAIMNTYRKKLLEYEEQLAAAQIQAGIEIGGNNPEINRAIEREELKKSCITLWTGLQYKTDPSITQNTKPEKKTPNNYPEIHIDNALAISQSIQFVEEAFDWKNMTYEFYPYYWGRKKNWVDIYPLEDKDPLFQDFLRAGAACVIVPVHLAATEIALYYQLTGKLWTGGDIPFFTEPSDPATTFGGNDIEHDEAEEELALYNAYLAELRGEEANEDIDKDIDINADDPTTWVIEVPTNLVWLQEESTLPVFEE